MDRPLNFQTFIRSVGSHLCLRWFHPFARNIPRRQHSYQSAHFVQQTCLQAYWDIGRIIVSRQKDKGWDRSVVKQLAADLQQEFPGISGFSASNLWRMRSFFMTYAEDEKLAPLVREIGWTNNVMIMEKCHDSKQREFYIRMTRKYGCV